MMRARISVRAMIFALTLGFMPTALQAQEHQWEMPGDAQRCPSKWGAKDEIGSGNLMKSGMALKAAKLIRTGEVFSLGFHLSSSLPLIGSRRFDLHTKRSTATDPGTRGENEEIVITELGQVGTQLDAFAHQIYGGEYYNCITDHEMSFGGGGAANDLTAGSRQGFPKLGVEKIPDVMTRGVLIDVAGMKNVEMLPAGYVITADDLQQALAKEKVKLETGDAVMINTGWGKLYTVKDKEKYLKSSPGIGIDAGEWLIKQNPMLVGADNCCVEARPYPGQKMNLPIHAMFLIANGVYLVENLKLEELAAGHAYETAYIMTPLKIDGGTGSTIAPIAVR
ncbi:MAG TPA: cyclase family protein [Candidatus Acidoferrales bacterium]|nr:cyclase family protein [Candidatus Acidoferrales bacterium]